MPPKKTITITVDSEIADELHGSLVDWVIDFYGEEASKIDVGDPKDV